MGRREGGRKPGCEAPELTDVIVWGVYPSELSVETVSLPCWEPSWRRFYDLVLQVRPPHGRSWLGRASLRTLQPSGPTELCCPRRAV